MKRTALALVFALSMGSLGAEPDILLNSNFAEGHAHWKGDALDIETPDAPKLMRAAVTTTPAGVAIKLKRDQWTKIFQTFIVRDPKLFYTVTFRLSPDYKLISQNNDDTSSADFTDVEAINAAIPLPEQNWTLLLAGGSTAQRALHPDLNKRSEPQSISGRLSDLNPGIEAVLVIAFPPGKGTVTLSSISLTNVDPDAEP
jgi:hypothetical protein